MHVTVAMRPSEVPAEFVDASGRTVSSGTVPVDSLLSPKPVIDTVSMPGFLPRWLNTLRLTATGSTPPPVAARTMAYEQRPHEELAEVLDVAEYLPRLLAEPEDRSAEFREQLVGLAGKYPSCTFAVERFDKVELGRW